MTRGGRTKTRDEAERRCIATGETQPKAGLIRFVVGPEGQVVPDILERLPGRGIWVSADAEALELATKKKLFSRGAKMQVTVPDDLRAQVDTVLTRRLTDLIALSRKGGYAVAGFEKVKGWLAEGRAKVLLQASDGSERGKTKLWTPEGGRFFGCLTAQELGLAFGRQSVIHGALAAGGLTPRVVEEAAKLQGLRKAIGGTAAGKEKTDA
ncbi:RNA-binding protein [Roseobacter sp. HKCCD9010]|uniref:RNA-binding protein n=1 Tax=unclassified Roseobacter TaxID=196798 RepID=UPI001490E03D|nr:MULTISPECIES: RNA-binding protein [unclassified Roseobacter]MBF9048460.1 RNA-binding protein [Rhodobacterales bacterium HKCCD4356]NNV10459.1 RNA-binding protein [Roseobacter sp. HKCCD7357]NNV14644.1 RNA-binding protein [Roseobacter sp. HKCCD8768]NNV24103.1 RNA-binding protein [Roseobacter sp. HKCCD8192]NNV28360.1 RNA-binding protein [Roseobacter sp. HKCCD9061]